MGISPQCLAHLKVAAPGFACQHQRGVAGIGLQGIDASNAIPVDHLRGSANDIVFVEPLHDSNKRLVAGEIEVVFRVPNGLAHILDSLALLGRELYLAEGVGTDGIEGGRQLRVALHLSDELHLVLSPVAKAV